ncbi:MAG TPA: hypothetical protein VGK49_11295 [Ilumatobacteraceae bacterium]
MSPHPTTSTEIMVSGANCPWCLNETLDLLRREPGVVSVHASAAGECITIRHDDVALERLLAVIRGRLHGEVVSSSEHVMVAVEPLVAELHCRHHFQAARDV